MKYKYPFFYFEPNIHINIGQPNTVLIYNFTTAKELVVNNMPFFLKVKQLIRDYEFGFYIDQDELVEICTALRDDLMGDIIDMKENNFPFLIPPHFLKVEKNREYFTKLESRNIKNNIFDYIFNLDFFIGIEFSDSIKNIFPYLSPDKVINNTCFDNWINCIKDYKFRSNLQSVNIYITNDVDEGALFIEQLGVLLGSNFINLHMPINLSKNYMGDYKKNIYFPYYQIENPKEFNQYLDKTSKSDYIIFIVDSEKQFSTVEKIASDKTLNNYSVYPHYNGNNYDFFRSNVFIEHSTLLEEKLSMDELFRNSQLNSNDFGRILIDSCGNYKTNLLGKTIGNIKNNDLQRIVSTCITNAHSSWFQTRNCVAPCSDCMYNQICPPISNYERALDKMDLCWKNLS